MTTAYNELYLDDAMHNLADMVEYAVCELGFDPDEFFGWFVSSGIASKFEKGNPKYITGMSGVELAEVVLNKINVTYISKEASHNIDKGKEYWAGWILAYYQWITGMRFEDMIRNGLSLSTVMSMYVLHEADESKFVENANEIIARHKENRNTRLQEIRKSRGFTQQQLSDASGVKVRMIQLYEQRQNDLSKARFEVVLSLAKALGCEIEDLID